VLAPNSNHDWEPNAERAAERFVHSAPSGSVLTVDLEIAPSVALEAARARRLCSVLDPSPADAVPDEFLALTDYVTPNAREIERLAGTKAAA
jgi:ribokinase